LLSVRSQLYRPIELVVVDNGSIDVTLEIANRYADLVDNWGPERSAQRNHGANLARGDYFLFIDSDMTLASSVVGDCVDALRADGEASAVVIPEVSVGEGFLADCRALERSCYVGDNDVEAARFFTRRAFEGAGGYDENLIGGEDWDLSVRVAGGRELPRTTGKISHDEGRLRLRTVLAKKRYYAGSAVLFWRKHGRASLGRANLVFRPAFLRNWRRLLRHPTLFAGIVFLKVLETAAGALGFVEAQLSNWHISQSVPGRVRDAAADEF
jgi:glycosyltransferase involved in cell wall biosynthesis